MVTRNPDRFVREDAPTGIGSVQIQDPGGDILDINADGSINVAGVTLTGPVTVSNEVEVKNDTGNPIPTDDATTHGSLTSILNKMNDVLLQLQGTINILGSVVVTNFPASVEVSNDSGNPLPVSGTVSVTEPVSVDDNGGSLTVDGSVAVTNFPASVEVSNDVGNPLPVNGTVSIGNFPASVEVSNDVGNPLPISGTVTSTPSGTQTVAIDQAGDNNDVDVLNMIPAVETGLAKDVTLTTRLPAGLDGDGGFKVHLQNPEIEVAEDISDRAARVLGHVDVDNFPATQTVNGTVTANLGTIDGVATETTLSEIGADIDAIETSNDVARSTRAADATLSSFAAKVPDEEGTWDYRAGTSGTVAVPAGGRIIGLAAATTQGSATVAINGGTAIPIPIPASGVGEVDIAPRANLVAPTIVFVNTDSYLIEFVT